MCNSSSVIIPDAIRISMVFASTSHVSEGDNDTFMGMSYERKASHWGDAECVNWIHQAADGFIVRLVYEDFADTLRERGISEEAINNLILLQAAGVEAVHFDADADQIEGLEVFDW